MIPPPPSATLFPYTTLFRSNGTIDAKAAVSISPNFDGGSAQLLVDGTATRTLTLPVGAVLPPLTVNAPNVTVTARDRKSTRLNSSHVKISYAVFCLKKKKVL